MVSLKYSIFFFLLSALFICSCAQVDSTNSITVEQLRDEMDTNENLVILDVRNPFELSGRLGQIDGVINIPVQELKSRINELDNYRENEIAVICKMGVRSFTATNILLDSGFSAVNVLGGMMEYRANKRDNK